MLLARISRIIDDKTGKVLRLNFTYANDETGEYRYRNASGREVTGWGRIKIVERPLTGDSGLVDKDEAIRTIVEKLKAIRK